MLPSRSSLLPPLAAIAVAAPTSGCGNTSCFVRGTPVLTPSGPRPIESLAPGDEVLSFDVRAREVVVRRVAKLLVRHVERVARLSAGELVLEGVSPDHPVWDDAAQAWRKLAELTLDSRVLGMLHGATPRVLALSELAWVPGRGPVEVYNLEVDGEEHDYFAGGVLVHNKAPADDGDYDRDGDGYTSALDCNDDDASVNPGAVEDCSNQIDDDCDGDVDGADADCQGGSGGQGGAGGEGGSGGAGGDGAGGG